MHPLLRLASGLLTGVVVFVLVGVGVTNLFDPRIEFSLFVGLPVGFWAGTAATLLTIVGLWYRDATLASTVDPWLQRSMGATVSVALDVMLLVAGGIAWYYLLDGGGDALGVLIFGVPATMVPAAVVGYLAVALLTGDDGEPDRRPTRSGADPVDCRSGRAAIRSSSTPLGCRRPIIEKSLRSFLFPKSNL